MRTASGEMPPPLLGMANRDTTARSNRSASRAGTNDGRAAIDGLATVIDFRWLCLMRAAAMQSATRNRSAVAARVSPPWSGH